MRTLLRLAALLAFAGFTANAQQYRVVAHWKLGGEGGWDYLLSDSVAHRLYVTHNARVEVVDSNTGKTLGAITGLKSTHGIALNPNGRTGYITDGARNSLVVFDRSTFAVQATVPAGLNPDGITYEPTTKTVWAFNGHSNSASVLDTLTNKIIATIPMPGKPEFPQADGHGYVYDNIENKNEIVKLDAKTHEIVATWPLAGCEAPSGMAIDHAKHLLFSVCDGGKMAIVDYNTGKLISLASIGDSPDAATFDARRGLVFSSNGGSGTLSVIDTKKPGFPRIQELATAEGARTMALDDATGRLYLVTAKFGPRPVPTAAQPHPRPSVVPGSFEMLIVEP